MCLRCRGLRGAGLDTGTPVDECSRPAFGPPISPCLSLSRDSFSARSRSSRLMIFFSRVLDIASARARAALFARLRVVSHANTDTKAHRTRRTTVVVHLIFDNFRITLRAAPFWQRALRRRSARVRRSANLVSEPALRR